MSSALAFPQSRCKFSLIHGDITPPENIYHRMWGAASHDRATGVHRNLRATVTIVAPIHGNEKQIIISLDHCVMGKKEMDDLLNRITNSCSITKQEVIVVFSHTHAAGLMDLERRTLPGGDLIGPYLEGIALKISQLINKSINDLQPATIIYGIGKCDLAANRDYWDEDNQTWVCGFNPRTKSDDTLLVAKVFSEKNSLIATLVNYACHPTTLAWDNTLISSDFVGSMREVIESVFDESPCLFLQGASGDLGPVEGFTGDPMIADKNGLQLGYASLSTFIKLPLPNKIYEYSGPVLSGATIGEWKYKDLTYESKQKNELWCIKRKVFELPIRKGIPSKEEVEADLYKWERSEDKNARAIAERKRRLLNRLNQLPSENTFPLEVIIIRLGGSIWLIMQGELYSTFQETLRNRFSEVPIIVSTIASHWGASYLPPKEIYGTGIYQDTIAIVEKGSLEYLINEISLVIKELLSIKN